MAGQLEEVNQLEEAFRLAADRISKNKKLKVNTEDKLKLYSYFKQAENGACSIPRPPFYDITGKTKWDAWKSLGSISKEEAMMHYVLLVNKLDPDWKNEVSLQSTESTDPERATALESGGGLFSVGAAVSTMSDKEEIPDDKKTIFDWCREGNTNKVTLLLKDTDANIKDENQMTLLHWACDRGSVKMVELLIEHKVPINQQDCDMQTPLHYASSCGHSDIVKLLIANKADTALKDIDDNDALSVASDDVTRLAFSQDVH